MARRSPLVVAALASVLVIVLGIIAALVLRRAPEPASPKPQPQPQPQAQPPPRAELSADTPPPAQPPPAGEARPPDPASPSPPRPAGLGDVIGQAQLARDEGRFEEALELLDEVFTVDPGNLEGLEILAEIHVERGESQRAFPLYLKLLDTQPQRPELRLPIARLAREHGDCELAEQMLRQMLEHDVSADTRAEAEALLDDPPARCNRR